ncbi:hypothetical protein [Thalassovita sp.]|uniref:hypothetical protein n=1 Tax=Thalassovita sp. TaxID=1979401 RepID=UPI002B273F32|nr:hypothetical protein [Thalassovita sp.]
MPARYKFLPQYGCLYLRFEEPFLFGKADDLVAAFTADQEFERIHRIIFDLSRLTTIKIDVTRSSDKVAKVGSNFPREGGSIAVLAPTETSLSMAELLRGLWASHPMVTYQVFSSDTELLTHLEIEQEIWDGLTDEALNTGL